MASTIHYRNILSEPMSTPIHSSISIVESSSEVDKQTLKEKALIKKKIKDNEKEIKIHQKQINSNKSRLAYLLAKEAIEEQKYQQKEQMFKECQKMGF